MKTYRKKIRNCIRPDTYKYFLDPEICEVAWNELCRRYGREQNLSDFSIRQINSANLLFRLVERDSSITVIEKEISSNIEKKKIHLILRYDDL